MSARNAPDNVPEEPPVASTKRCACGRFDCIVHGIPGENNYITPLEWLHPSEALDVFLQDFKKRHKFREVENVEVVDDILGSCGCTDYHMADCPLRSTRIPYYEQKERTLQYQANLEDDYYDEDF